MLSGQILLKYQLSILSNLHKVKADVNKELSNKPPKQLGRS